MRIELNAGGLGGAAAISSFHTDFSGLISKSKKALSVFQVVRQQSYNMNGGIGNLQGAVNEIETRITAEETKVAAIETVEKKTNSFLELAIKTDIQASVQVNKSKNEFYRVNPWAKPPDPPEEKKWYQKAGEWLYNKGKEAVDGIKKAWNNVKEWCSSNIGRIVLGVVAVIGAIAIIATVIASGGLALVPLLTAWGLSAGVATAISATVGIVAVVSTSLALIPNTLDLAAAVDEVIDPSSNKISDFNNKLHQNKAYNTFQTVANVTSAISGGMYSIGSAYNAKHGISNADLKNYTKQPQSANSYASVPASEGGTGEITNPSETHTNSSKPKQQWQKSEDAVTHSLGEEYGSQVTISKDGTISSGTSSKGSVRPDNVAAYSSDGSPLPVTGENAIGNVSDASHFEIVDSKNCSLTKGSRNGQLYSKNGAYKEAKSNDNSTLPKNHRAICENATNDDISSIGRNAFALTYDYKTNIITIKNVAKGAIFSVETGGRKNDLRSGQTDSIMKGTKILLGNYTTVIIHNFTVNNG